jgi:WD40 repeat protein
LAEPRRLGEEPEPEPVVFLACDPAGRFVVALREDGRIRLYDVGGEEASFLVEGPPGTTELYFTDDGATGPGMGRESSFLQAVAWSDDDNSATTSVWSLAGTEPTFLRQVDLGKPGNTAGWTLDPVSDRLVSAFNADGRIRIWPLRAPADASPMVLSRGPDGDGVMFHVAMHPEGGWFATSSANKLALWPLTRSYAIVIDHGERLAGVTFAPDGRWLAASEFAAGRVRLWALDGEARPAARTLFEMRSYATGLASSPDGEQILAGFADGPRLLSPGGDPPRALEGRGDDGAFESSVALSADGRWAASFDLQHGIEPAELYVWDVQTGEQVAVLENALGSLRFTPEGRLLAGGSGGLRRWDLETGTAETLVPGFVFGLAIDAEARHALLRWGQRYVSPNIGPVSLLDLETGRETPLTVHGDRVNAIAMDAAGTMVVTGDVDGTIRVGRLADEEPHLLLGAGSAIQSLAVDPQGRWIASASGSELRLWPIPDLSQPPLHTLPREELVAKLRSLTNVRGVRDTESTTGWKLSHDPFPGWRNAPSW